MKQQGMEEQSRRQKGDNLSVEQQKHTLENVQREDEPINNRKTDGPNRPST